MHLARSSGSLTWEASWRRHSSIGPASILGDTTSPLVSSSPYRNHPSRLVLRAAGTLPNKALLMPPYGWSALGSTYGAVRWYTSTRPATLATSGTNWTALAPVPT